MEPQETQQVQTREIEEEKETKSVWWIIGVLAASALIGGNVLALVFAYGISSIIGPQEGLVVSFLILILPIAGALIGLIFGIRYIAAKTKIYKKDLKKIVFMFFMATFLLSSILGILFQSATVRERGETLSSTDMLAMAIANLILYLFIWSIPAVIAYGILERKTVE
ncbi:MAG: hypothetical protein HYV77_01895 [Candidatus Wildermuthbacteria bacterium]|nr:hypothetical protein [Candidatus Wildermuthbacteria bacterium]